MRKFHLLFLCIYTVLNSIAQNISVKSFSLDETDVTANLDGTTKYDQNGEKCALIKIFTTATGLTFDVGSLGVVDIIQKPGEIWLYVPHGVRRLIMNHAQLGKCEYTFTIPVEKAHTYNMEVVAGEVQTIIKNAVTSQYVLFRVTPSNASIEIDGQMLEVRDGGASKRMPFGTYDYKVQAPHYYAKSGQVTVNDPQNKHIVNVSLEPAFSTVTMQVDADAEIWIDDTKRSTRTFTGELAYGTYLVECRQQGHRTSQKEVTITKENASQKITLPKPTPIYGSIDVNSSPLEANIYIDDKHVGTTPMLLPNYLVGTHTIKLSKAGHSDFSQVITVEEGQTFEVNAKLEVNKKDAESTLTSVIKDKQKIMVAGLAFYLIPVEGGTFIMGSKASDAYGVDKPTHSVTLNDYYIGQTEVTQELWQAVMGNNPSRFTGRELPVENVTWDDCQTFIRKLNSITGKNFRLPTEAEWEYAACGGKKSHGYRYSGSDNINDVAWFENNSGDKTHPVARKKPNELGLYDMSGNVQEWCSDLMTAYSNKPQVNPQGASYGRLRVVRGGNWYSNERICNISDRRCYPPEHREFNLGLRLVMPK